MRRKGLITFITSTMVILIMSFISLEEINRMHLKGPYLDGVFPEETPSFYKLRGVLKSLGIPWFTVRIKAIPDSRDLLALEKSGTISKFSWDDDERIRVILDLRDVIMDKGESGILDLAFHPQFHNAASEHYREVYVIYNYAFDREQEEINYLRVSKFYFTEDVSSIDRSSESILIQQFAENPNHNGGRLFFDEEEYLYITIGDEGGYYDLYGNGQKINRELFSGILRIDVNNDASRSHPIRRQPRQSGVIPTGHPGSFTQNYMIPDDNPWINESGSVLEEFYAIGLRNPFTATLDPESGGIWIGDVGQEGAEEISLITKGANGQWPYIEGLIRHQETPSSVIGTEVLPTLVHNRSEAKSIICGYVYRGDAYPDLKNKLIYGDFITGTIWAYDLVTEESVVLVGGGRQVLQIFEGPDEEIYVLVLGGEIYRLVPPNSTPIPQLLSETGAFEDLRTLTPAPGVLPYEIRSPLWSDGADKQRWVSVPDNRPIDYDRKGPWSFFGGTVFIKHFEMDLGGGNQRRLETRFFIKDAQGVAYGLSYKWNEEGTDAVLIDNYIAPVDTLEFLDGSRRAWNYPSRGQCMQCHTEAAGYILGVKTAQLNGPIFWNDELHENQVALWQTLGLFTELSPLENLPAMADLGDSTASSLVRFKSYLDANCASCHRPEGVAPQFDARFETPFEEQDLVFKSTEGFNSLNANHLITPGDTATSELFRRDVEELASWKMPPVGRNMVDTTYITFLKQFITDLGAPVEVVRDTVCEGETYFFRDSTYRVIEEDLYDSIRYTGSFGIDSLVIYDLFTLPVQTQMVSDTVCYGDTYTFLSGETLTDITATMTDSSWVNCTYVITELTVQDPSIPCEVLPFELSMGPNPTDLNYVVLYTNQDVDEISLIDVFGKQVKNMEVTFLADGVYQMVIPDHLLNGLYVLRVMAGDQLQTRKLIVNR